jgi:hypothetical protein
MKKIIFLFFYIGLFSQNYNTTNFNTDSNFNLIRSEISAPYKKEKINFSGNRYFYKEYQKALVFMFERNDPIEVKTNYNLLEQTFDINYNNETLKLLPNKVQRVRTIDNKFLSLKGKFYELILENDSFLLLADTYLEIYIPDYQPGIQAKPDPTYRKKNSILLYQNNIFKKIERRKKFLLSLFDSSKSKEINNFMKKNKISPSDNNDLSNLFLTFFEDLKI